MHTLLLLCITQNIKFEVPSFTNYKDIIGGKIFFNELHDPDYAH